MFVCLLFINDAAIGWYFTRIRLFVDFESNHENLFLKLLELAKALTAKVGQTLKFVHEICDQVWESYLIYTKHTCMLYIMYLCFWVNYNNSVSFRESFIVWCISGKNFKQISFSGKKLLYTTLTFQIKGIYRCNYILHIWKFKKLSRDWSLLQK